MARASDPKWVGIRRKGAGWQAAVSRGPGKGRVFKTFGIDTTPDEMQAWRDDVKADLRLTRRRRATRGMFEADADRYLRAVKAMPTIKDRMREIALWKAEFGRRQREDITAADIRIVRDRWLTDPRSAKDVRPVSPGTVNKRLRALSNLWTVLDGPRALNPVRDVPEAVEPSYGVRALALGTVAAILAQMPDVGHVSRRDKGTKRPSFSQTKARLTVMAYTGWPPSILAALRPEDIDLEHAVATLPARRKGKGHPAVTVPLLPEAVAALRVFAEANLWGPFDQRSANRSWKRAAKKAKVTLPTRAYDLRHSFLSAVGQASKDERAVQALAQHGDIRTTRRYTEGSVATRLTAALAAVGPVTPEAEGGSLSDEPSGA